MKNFPINKLGAIISACCLITFSFLSADLEAGKSSNTAPSLNFSNFPTTLGDWQGEDSLDLDKKSLDTLQLSSYTRRIYKNKEGQSIYLYLGYWKEQTGEHQAAKHSPALCLPSNGWLTNHLPALYLNPKDFGIKSKIETRRIIAEKGRNKELFYYWFFAGQDYYSSEWFALIKLSIENILYGRSDGGIVEISTPLLGNGQTKAEIDSSERIMQSFLKDLIPYLDNQIKASQSSKSL